MRVLVTGVGSGIGAATARVLSGQGAEVVGLDRDEASLAEALADGSCASVVACDLADPVEVAAALGPLQVDAVANVAGIGPDAGDARAVFAIDLRAPLLVVATLERCLPAGAPVVNVASVIGHLAKERTDEAMADPLDDDFLARAALAVPDPAAAYACAKRALLDHTRRLAVRATPRLRCNAVSPGVVDTPLGARSMTFDWTRRALDEVPEHRLARPEEVADVVAFLLGPSSSFVNGACLPVDGGYLASRAVRWRSAP